MFWDYELVLVLLGMVWSGIESERSLTIKISWLASRRG